MAQRPAKPSKNINSRLYSSLLPVCKITGSMASNPVVFFDVSAANQPLGRIEMTVPLYTLLLGCPCAHCPFPSFFWLSLTVLRGDHSTLPDFHPALTHRG